MRSRRSQRGFTLAEITIAVLVLSAAVIVMISLQSASVDSSFRDERRQKALLAARAIFSALEIQEDPPENIDITGSLADIIKKQDALKGLTDWNELKVLNPFQAHLTIQNAPLPIKQIPQDALKKVSLQVSWSGSSADMVELFYFIPKKN